MLSIMLAISGYIIFRSTPSGRMRGLGVQVATWGILVGALKAKGLLPYAYFQYYALGGVMLESLFFMVSVYLHLKDLAAERERLAASLKEANLNLLQSRGRPHFLSNTFSMVRAMLKTDPVRADKAFELLVADFRFFTDSVSAPLVSLHDEVAFVENYLAIMSLRHGDRLMVDRHCAAVASCMIPPLSLQPLLENGIKHGTPDTADGILRLSVLLTESAGELRFQTVNHCGLPDNPDYSYGDTHANIVARMRYYHPGATLKLSVLDGNFTAELAWATGAKA
jgi:LytS/YehU family sensor histidine kinase